MVAGEADLSRFKSNGKGIEGSNGAEEVLPGDRRP
jgi:hypothetical protein